MYCLQENYSTIHFVFAGEFLHLTHSFRLAQKTSIIGGKTNFGKKLLKGEGIILTD